MSGHAFVYPEDHFKSTLSRDVYDLLVGDHIATGYTREVHACIAHPDCVVKLENNAKSFHNIYEHQVWEKVKDTKFAKWFAPVHSISSNGTVLIMKRTTKPRLEDLPAEIPAFFTDVKPENFGMYEGRIVCHDYGFHKLIERGLTKAMRKVDWEAV